MYEDAQQAGSFNNPERNARLFCEIMRDDFAKYVKVPEEEVEKQRDWTYERPLATKGPSSPAALRRTPGPHTPHPQRSM